MAIHAFCKWRSKWPGDGLPRRSLVGAALAWPLALRAEREAVVEVFDLSLLDEAVTHNELFFVREHFPAPAVSTHEWKLSVAGAAVSYEQLAEMPTRVVAATLECAENPVGGGLVSHAEWEGVPLKALLEKSAPKAFVRFSSRDGFARYVPYDKAAHPDTLLVLRMNGSTLPPGHGGPVRAMLPGWYGMDWVKWLDSVELRDAADEGKDYRRRTQSLLGAATGDPVGAVGVKSVFARPVDGAVISGRRFTLRGAAWAGENRVAKVEVSADGGNTWLPARFGESKPYCWSLWQCEWKIARAGEYRLVVRASDGRGRVQPPDRDARRSDSYEQNHWQRIVVTAI